MSKAISSHFSLGLTGYPLGHSLSPRLHAAALAATALDGEYRLYPISPDDSRGLAELLARVRSAEVDGLNVTIPHKQAVIPYLDQLTSTAQAIGAVNTISMRDGRLIGDNTDAPGFLADLKELFATESAEFRERQRDGGAASRSALVLGAGGSARAVVYALSKAGWRVTICARRLDQADMLSSAFDLPHDGSRPAVIEYSAAKILERLSEFSLIVNTTPLGMSPQPERCPWPDGLAWPRADVYDLVYNPRETRFVRLARSAGLRARSGLGMLVEQAALAFELWTGRKPPRDVMFAAVEAPHD